MPVQSTEKNINILKIQSLNGLRFFFFLGLYCHHLSILNNLKIFNFAEIYKYLREGFLGVTFFFILSGFMISYGYVSKMKNKEVSSIEFLFYRIARLWPLHLVCLLLDCLIFRMFGTIGKEFWINLFMLQSFFPDVKIYFSYNAVSWCNSTQLFFYAAFCVLGFIPKMKKIGILLWLLLTSTIISFYPNYFTNTHWLIYINPLFRLIDFLIGMLLYDYFTLSMYKKPLIISKVKSSVLELASILLLVLFIIYGSNHPSIMIWKYDIYYVLPLSLIILVFSGCGVFSYILKNKVVQYLGTISFEMYLVHQMVLFLVKKHMINYITSLKSIILYAMLSLFITMFISMIMHHLIEKPLYKKAKKNIEIKNYRKKKLYFLKINTRCDKTKTQETF